MWCRSAAVLLALAATSCEDPGQDASTTDDGADTDWDPDWEPIALRFEDYEVPSAATTYACRGFSIATPTPQHLVAFEPTVDDHALVHHMVLYRLAAPPPGEVFPCDDMPRGAVAQFGWAPGTGPVELPAEAGLPVGDAGEVTHFALQIHYDNPGQQFGHRDGSGMVAYATDELREYDAGVLTLGMVDSIAIPGGLPRFEQANACDTRDFATTLHVFGSLLHGHEILREIWTDQRRAGTSIGDLGRDDHFDFNLQRFVPLDHTIEAGDILITHCAWDSTARPEATLGGESSTDEMCLNSLFYYPRLATPYCGAG
jgi:dopamine beta-monooxygenase